MTVLAAQHIRKLCEHGWMRPTSPAMLAVDGGGNATVEAVEYTRVKMIHPFVERGEFMGKTFGLGPCTYDFTLDKILTDDNTMLCDYTMEPGEAVLASTLEHVDIPFNVCGTILDKSSWARVFVSAFNTHFDPGFFGYPTLELVNLSRKPLHITHGMPIIQMKFELLLEPTDMPYAGKYNSQPARPVAALEGDGSWGTRSEKGMWGSHGGQRMPQVERADDDERWRKYSKLDPTT